ncbi:MAG: MotA/TolQ/ExbB proton channel family protein [Pararhodobacter sp.]|nr:MotA/TolQ/ExbB proton channel family protein [Pararhodobacter sp.]
MTALADQLARIADLGGPVVLLLIALSVAVVAVALAKLWQFRAAGMRHHGGIEAALAAWDRGERARAMATVATLPHHLAPLALAAMAAPDRPDSALRARLTGLAEGRIANLTSGLRIIDSVAQVAPLLGLFGTVLGMIEAFQALQAAGQAVDPAALAGGIWVALLTTAVGLAVAMPAALVLTWFDSRIAAEARLAGRIIDTVLCTGLAPMPAGRPASPPQRTPTADAATAHG